MDKVGTVHSGMETPHYLPEFENPIYKAAQAQKAALRDEALTRIKAGSFPNGLALLADSVLPLSTNELAVILSSWNYQGFHEYAASYGYALAMGDLEAIKQVDLDFSNKQTKGPAISR